MSPELNIVTKAAQNAGGMLNQANRVDDLLSIKKKKAKKFVDKARSASEFEIINTLKTAYPEDGIIADVNGDVGCKNADRTWFVNPLSGQKNFLHGIPHYAISIALLEKDKIILGCIYDPEHDDMYVATRGGGAILNQRKLRIEPTLTLEDSVIATGFPDQQSNANSRFMVQFKTIYKHAKHIKIADSSVLDLAFVAAGRYDGYWKQDLSYSSMLAATLLIEEAGGQCLDFKAGRKHLGNGTIIAGNLNITGAIAAKFQKI